MARSGSKSSLLEFAVLGLLQESPMHGYELRKRLNTLLGTFSAISYGSLYPCLKSLESQGLITSVSDAEAEAPALSGKRARIVYELTADGKDRFAELVAESGPETWDDDAFGVRFAFFGSADADVRRHILEGRRSRLQERLSTLRSSVRRTGERLDNYTLELQRHGLESVEREVSWIDGLLADENGALRAAPSRSHSGSTSTGPTGSGSTTR